MAINVTYLSFAVVRTVLILCAYRILSKSIRSRRRNRRLIRALKRGCPMPKELRLWGKFV